MTQMTQRLKRLHTTLQEQLPQLRRVAVVLYDNDSDLLSTYVYSSEDPNPLPHYNAYLSDVPSLANIARSGCPRVIEDLSQHGSTVSPHTKALLEAGYHASVTIPMYRQDQLLGFVFFNTTRPKGLSRYQIPLLEMSCYAISLLIVQERTEVNTLKATMKSAIEVTHQRNPETGEHLKRISGYTRLVATHLAGPLELSDEYLEHLVQFSALHDIGKIAIADHILLKPGRLTPEEFDVMKTHTTRGRELVDHLIHNHALESIDYIDLLRNIIELHHENWDGSGYPHGLSGEAIPLEARIVAVADVYDALTGERPYKNRMSTEKTFALINSMRGVKLDPRCVDALAAHLEEAEAIRARYLPADHELDNGLKDRPEEQPE